MQGLIDEKVRTGENRYKYIAMSAFMFDPVVQLLFIEWHNMPATSQQSEG